MNSANNARPVANITLNSLKYRETYVNVLTRKEEIKRMVDNLDEKNKYSAESSALRLHEIDAIKR